MTESCDDAAMACTCNARALWYQADVQGTDKVNTDFSVQSEVGNKIPSVCVCACACACVRVF